MTSAMLFPWISMLFPAGMALAASMDLLTMTIPNRLCLALSVGYAILAIFAGIPSQDILFNLSCGLAVLGLTFGLFSFGWIGGGDAKLAAATALWLGWGYVLSYGVTSAIYGGVLTVAIIIGRRINLPAALARQVWIARLHNPNSGVPYGIALAAAGIAIYPQTQIWQTLTSV